jgi:hypothetical protein
MPQNSENIVLICNPAAGGRWKQLAGILDSAEAAEVRRVVTDSIEDIGPALHSLSKRVKLLCIYGGDGTIQKLLNAVFRSLGDEAPPVVLLGGGTMNVTSTWCGWTGSPEKNFRRVIRDYLTDKLLTREVPMLSIEQGDRVEYGFTWGAGTVIRILDAYEHGSKGKLAALVLAGKCIAGAWSLKPRPDMQYLLEQMEADIALDGVPLPYHRFAGVFCNITGHVVRLVHPFLAERQRETFHALAYAITARELATLAPLIIRGLNPIDPKALIKPISSWMQLGLSFVSKGSLPTDPRYVNRPAQELEMRSKEKVFTIDGEIFESTGEPIRIRIGPTLRLAVSA